MGCGGGTCTRAWHELGAATLTGVDFSRSLLDAAFDDRSSSIAPLRPWRTDRRTALGGKRIPSMPSDFAGSTAEHYAKFRRDVPERGIQR